MCVGLKIIPLYNKGQIHNQDQSRMTPEDYLKLYEKYQSEKCSPEEIKLLMDHFSQFEFEQPDQVDTIEDLKIKQSVYRRIENNTGINKRIFKLQVYRWSVAAVFLIITGVAIIFLIEQPIQIIKESLPAVADRVKPGGPVATLTLADGRIIELGQAANGILPSRGEVKIRKLKNGELVYENESAHSKTVAPEQHTISIPRGGHYQVVLNDGTKVWLNAESTLTFPTVFSGSERRVELLGEAYFEIAHNKKMPFKVISRGQTVEVLGTHFNIASYSDEHLIKTTLLKGSIKVSLDKEGITRILKPGEQSQVGNTIDVVTVDANEAITWKNGYFVFDNESIFSVMRKIGRWYDVEVNYEAGFADQNFWGSIPRSSDLSDVLRKLELTKTVKFEIKGRRVLVKK